MFSFRKIRLFFILICIYNMSTFLFHPPRIMDCGVHGRSCYAHHICGSLLTEDDDVHYRRLQMLVDGKEKSVIATYHVLDGIDCGCVGFFKSELTKFSGLQRCARTRATRLLCCCNNILLTLRIN